MGYFSLWIPQVLSVNLDSPAVLPASVLIQHFFSVLLWTSVDNDYISNCYNTMLDYHIIDKNFSGPVMKLLVAPFFFFWPMYFLDVVGLSHKGAQFRQRPDLSGKACPILLCTQVCFWLLLPTSVQGDNDVQGAWEEERTCTPFSSWRDWVWGNNMDLPLLSIRVLNCPARM